MAGVAGAHPPPAGKRPARRPHHPHDAGAGSEHSNPHSTLLPAPGRARCCGDGAHADLGGGAGDGRDRVGRCAAFGGAVRASTARRDRAGQRVGQRQWCGAHDGLTLVTKAGGFGDEDTLAVIVNHLHTHA